MEATTTEDAGTWPGSATGKSSTGRSAGFSSFAAGFSYISILTGVFQMFYLGFAAGGPAFFWTWPMVFLGQFTVALCFAELAAHYPLSGGVYQWSKRVGSPGLGWMTGWVYLACAVISLAAVALALQATLPQIAPVFQVIGDGSDAADRARNAVLLGCVLIGLIDADQRGRRPADGPDQQRRRLHRAGRRGAPDRPAPGEGAARARDPARTPRAGPRASRRAISARSWPPSVMASYVMYGFDTAGHARRGDRRAAAAGPLGDPPGAGRRRGSPAAC